MSDAAQGAAAVGGSNHAQKEEHDPEAKQSAVWLFEGVAVGKLRGMEILSALLNSEKELHCENNLLSLHASHREMTRDGYWQAAGQVLGEQAANTFAAAVAAFEMSVELRKQLR